MKEYKVGDEAWWARYETLQVEKPCPVCCGKLEVTVILGDGTPVITPCDYCGKGWEGPRGYVTEWQCVSSPQRVSIAKVHIEEQEGERTVTYRVGCYVLYPEDLFDTKEEAEVRVQEKITAQAVVESTRAEYLKGKATKSFSWNVGYHLREAGRLERDALSHREKARLCKERAKGEPK